jgi:hypothetical protein
VNVITRMFFLAAATWGVSSLISLVLIGVTAGVTQKWAAGRMQPVVAVLLGIIVIIFVAGILFFHSSEKRILQGAGSPWLYTVLYAAAAVLSMLILAVISLVALNR